MTHETAEKTGPVLSATAAAQPRIGVLIVAYNAVTTLRQVLRRIPRPVYERVEEVVVFDDASPDATFELATGLKTLGEFEKLHVVRNPTNLGYGGNQKAGYRYFQDKGFDIVVLLHGDGQYAPEMLAEMYEPIVRGEASAVFGSRMMKDHGGALKGGMPLYKYVGNRILTAYENRALGMKLTEFHSGYRAYSLAALRRIDLDSLTNDFHFDTQIIVKLNHQGFRIREIAIPTYYGSEICYVNGMRYAWDVFRTVRRYKASVNSFERHAEYSEYYIHYPIKQSRYSSHYHIIRQCGTGAAVLDLGGGEGRFAAELAARGNRVTAAGSGAGPEGPAYVQADLSRELPSQVEGLAERRFDKIVCMDAAEHVEDPARLLKDCRKLLDSNGVLIVAVPNVAHLSVRLLLLFGRFRYTERGILDRTHVHFFTRSTARALLRECGYEIVREAPTVMPLDLIFRASYRNPVVRLMTECLHAVTRIWPSLLGYEFVFTARARSDRA